MLDALKNAFQIADLRKKLVFTALMLVVYRLGSFIPVPGVDPEQLTNLFRQGGNIFGLLDLFAGGNLSRFTVFALGVNPYITASIIIQLLTVVIPKLEEMAKEGVEGRKKLAQYTRYGTVLLAVIQAYGTYLLISRTQLTGGASAIIDPGLLTTLLIITTLTAGSMFLMWLGEIISEFGIGNGISLIIFFGIVARIPASIISIAQSIGAGGLNPLAVLGFLVIAVFIIAGVIMIQEGQRRIPVQYAKRVVGRRLYGGASTNLPLRVNQAGVIPVIFASSVLALPLTLLSYFPAAARFARVFGYGSFWYNFIEVILIIFFTFFYTAISFNPLQVADNMKKYGGFIPGLRPGRPTAEYLERVLTRITFVGALFLAAIAVLPTILTGVFRMQAFYFGGTSLLIMVGVALDTMRQIEAHLLMRHYEGFIK
ncbi:MAG: preprotein translocase subunit SecY [Bacillota bacterium]|nr:preprotein translocase subunit SecY [Bacillota bacterium]